MHKVCFSGYRLSTGSNNLQNIESTDLYSKTTDISAKLFVFFFERYDPYELKSIQIILDLKYFN